MGNFRETFGNFLETVRVVIGQESVQVGMWSREYMKMFTEIFQGYQMAGCFTFNPHGRNQPICERHVTIAGRNSVTKKN